MNELVREIIVLIIALAFAVFAAYKLLKTKRAHDAIDSVADARVIKVLNLGRGFDGKPQFAITYQVLIDAPFEILVTPTSTPAAMGDLVTIYYDSFDHTNYYIPLKWRVDDRLKKAGMLMIFAAITVIGCTIALFK